MRCIQLKHEIEAANSANIADIIYASFLEHEFGH